MANVRAQGMKSLSQQMELAGANNDKIGETWDRVSSWKPSKPMADGKPRLVGDNRDFKSKGGRGRARHAFV